METLKFLMISTHYPPNHLGGDAVLVEYLSTELMKRGHEVHVLHSPTAYEVLRGKHADAKNPNPSVPTMHQFRTGNSSLNLIRTLSLGTSSRVISRTKELIREISPDVVHWHNTKGFIGTPIRTENATSLYTAHDYFAVCPRSNLLRPDLSICEMARFCQLCHIRWRKPPPIWRIGGHRILDFPPETLLLSPSDFLARRLQSEGISEVKVLRNFVPDSGRSSLSDTQITESILYLGMLETHKGPQTLVEAFNRTRDEHGFSLDIVGEGPLKEKLKSRIIALGLRDRIRVTGFLSREDLNRIRKGAMAQIIPSEWPENAPLTALEALSLGTPLIGSDYGGLPEILKPENGCRTFKGGSTEDLAQNLIRLWEERGNGRRMRDDARKAYESGFTPEVHIKSYLEIIRAHEGKFKT